MASGAPRTSPSALGYAPICGVCATRHWKLLCRACSRHNSNASQPRSQWLIIEIITGKAEHEKQYSLVLAVELSRNQTHQSTVFTARRGAAGLAGRPPALRQRAANALASASTSATWPGTFTLRQTRRITPDLSIRKVDRSMPMYLRPYMLFSTQAP